MAAQQIIKRVEAILEYMQPYWEFANCHMVNYLIDKHWERYMPAELKAEVQKVELVLPCIEQVFWRTTKEGAETTNVQFKSFCQFLRQSEEHRLQNFDEILTSAEQLQKLLAFESEKQLLTINDFMSEKKGHEVKVTAQLINDLIAHHLDATKEEVVIIDAGDGKGYLSSRLALEYGHKVLGLDANKSNTENALERSKKLKRVWRGLLARAQLESQGITPPARNRKTTNFKGNSKFSKTETDVPDNYRTLASFITSELNLLQLVKELFPSHTLPPALCLTGLHTCGNLAPTCLRLFHVQSHCKVLCNVGCCYHLLKESYSEQELHSNTSIMPAQAEDGFPMSQYLRRRCATLGRNARMLAAQSIERTLAAKELPNVSLYYRALLEVFLTEQKGNLNEPVRVGRVRKFKSFQEYMELCLKKTALPIETVPADAFEHLQSAYAEHKHYLELFYLLRMTFAPILESLILLDRLLYLKELNYTRSYLIPLFDAVISPRRFAIVALK